MIFINGVKRIHEAVSESISVNIKRHGVEMPDMGPEMPVAFVEGKGGAETLLHDREPDLRDAVGRQLAFLPLGMHRGFEAVEGDLTRDGIEHILDLLRENRPAPD